MRVKKNLPALTNHNEPQMRIGPYNISNRVVLAPMAGVTDQPFRELCLSLGASMAVSEMVSSQPGLRDTRKSRLRMTHQSEGEPRIVQIVGADPEQMANAARFNVAQGAQIIDINMGCPAKKVCSVAAGSALLQNESLVERILATVVDAVEVPVTLKIRTGQNRQNNNALRIAMLAEQAGIQALSIHGRSRACRFGGEAEQDTARIIKQTLNIPIITNGDIDTPEKARDVLESTGADAIMIGRAAQGRPWIFREINHFLATGIKLPAPSPLEAGEIMLAHLARLHDFYGEFTGVRVARKHIGWYCKGRLHAAAFRQKIMRVEDPRTQLALTRRYFDTLDTQANLAA